MTITLKKNWRLISATLVICLGLSIASWYLFKGSTESRLSGKIFCLISFKHKGKEVQTKTIGIRLVFQGSCAESVTFHPGNTISLPGINSNSAYGIWEVVNDKIRIHDLRSNQELYAGEYDVNFEDNGDVFLRSTENEIKLRYTPIPNPLQNILR